MMDGDGMMRDDNGSAQPGQVLGLMAKLRDRVGTVKAKVKAGVRFKVRSLDELVDRVRPAAHELGLLVYPVDVRGEGHPVEDGTLASVTLRVRVQAVVDGSYVEVAGFGLGADQQDKAGGKAGSYAFKQALIQALLAGGAEDTDDTDSPVPGGVRRKVVKPAAADVRAAFEAASTPEDYQAAVQLARQLTPDAQLACKEAALAAKRRVNGDAPAAQ